MIRVFAVLMAVCLPLSAAHMDPIINQEQLVDRMGMGQAPPLIDVRTPEEYRAGHIPGAINIPLQEFEQRFAELSAYKDGEAVLYVDPDGDATLPVWACAVDAARLAAATATIMQRNALRR